ncbi:MAG: RapZ C-terminal domain-containing protein, partial [Acidimicrobiales bacterium]
GCTGGRHRSVAIAEEVARLLRRHGMRSGVLHRDVDK